MTSSPLVSVIIPAYKGQQRIARAVRSIIAQDYTNWEIVIISDDQSDYQQVLADQGIRHPRIQFHSTGHVASGAANARNVGLNHAHGDVIALLDCDDAYDPARISAMLPLVKKYGAAVSQLQMIDEAWNLSIPNLSLLVDDERMFPDQVGQRCFHGMSLAMFDRKKITHHYQAIEKFEDNVFLMQMYNVVDAIGFHASPMYHYYKYFGTTTQFSADPVEVTNAFRACAVKIKDFIMNEKIYLRSEALKKFFCAQMDFCIAAQEFFVEASRDKPNLKFNEAMGPFLEQWPLPASLRIAT